MKKRLIITISVLLAVFVVGITAGVLLMNFSGLGISTGVVLKSDNGTCFLISHNSPIRLSDYSPDGNKFDSLSDGDKILVLHNGIAESYPASTLPYLTLKLADGTTEDVPESVISSLTELGWLGVDAPESIPEITGSPVYMGNENANFSITLPEGWSYEETPESPIIQSQGFGISIYHTSAPESTITIEFTESFGVCGTGLRTEEITIGEYKATKGIYDGNPTFDYIIFENTPGFYVIHNYADASWWAEHKNEISSILGTIRLADGIILHGDALEIALSQAKGEYTPQYNEYSAADGLWTFVFETDETSETIKIDKNGNIA